MLTALWDSYTGEIIISYGFKIFRDSLSIFGHLIEFDFLWSVTAQQSRASYVKLRKLPLREAQGFD